MPERYPPPRRKEPLKGRAAAHLSFKERIVGRMGQLFPEEKWKNIISVREGVLISRRGSEFPLEKLQEILRDLEVHGRNAYWAAELQKKKGISRTNRPLLYWN